MDPPDKPEDDVQMTNNFRISNLKLAIFFLIFFLLSSCAPYLEQSRPALRAYYRGDFEEAANLADSIHPRKSDRMVAYLDKGTIFHVAKEYKKSIKYFSKAADLADKKQNQAFIAETGAVFTNDNILPYIASPYERLLIHIYLMLNYAAMDQFDEALVEVRRINTIFEPYIKDPLSLYLSGLVWEANSLCNDAYIDYTRLNKLRTKPKGLKQDIERTGICSGLIESKKNEMTAPNLILVYEQGKAPKKVSTEHKLPLQIIPVPRYTNLDSTIERARVKIDGRNRGYLNRLEDLNITLREALEDQMAGIVARAMARLAVKEGAAAVIREKVDEDLGDFLAIAVLLTNRADLRSWRTLPQTFQIWRGYIPPGKHTISIDFLDINGKKIYSKSEDIELEQADTKLMVFRTII